MVFFVLNSNLGITSQWNRDKFSIFVSEATVILEFCYN